MTNGYHPELAGNIRVNPLREVTDVPTFTQAIAIWIKRQVPRRIVS
jgi:hypothetical protein